MINGKSSKLLPQHKKMAMGDTAVGFSDGGKVETSKKIPNYSKKGYNKVGVTKKYVK